MSCSNVEVREKAILRIETILGISVEDEYEVMDEHELIAIGDGHYTFTFKLSERDYDKVYNSAIKIFDKGAFSDILGEENKLNYSVINDTILRAEYQYCVLYLGTDYKSAPTTLQIRVN
ncbi:hypothetical protein HX049_07630 [Myroides odoratimimus]|uniref:hypothetical protein n=1 Tax=Myroides odoratimimus TaxID=76832 RepID=UPI002578D70D|nr:hypothetical protein [Myroides odoratimimus]MDM1397043.1 hypothetical protein [Myroides odoratimimus]